MDDTCYYVETQAANNWHDANSNCHSIGGDTGRLASIYRCVNSYYKSLPIRAENGGNSLLRARSNLARATQIFDAVSMSSEMGCIVTDGVFPKWNWNSLNSANSGNLINHWSINLAQFKHPVPHMCLAGVVVTSCSLTQEVAGWQVWALLL